MPVSTNTVWEFRTTATANMVNGGGFVTGASGVDYSQQDAAQYALTGIATSGAGNVFLTAAAAADMVGNIAHVVSGTNFTAGWYEITSVSVGVSVTCGTNGAGGSLSSGVGANGVINIGGALDLAGALQDSFFEQINLGNTVWFKSGTYTLAASISTASTLSTAATPSIIKGYEATRGDNPIGSTRPLVVCGANSWTMGQYQDMSYMQITGTAANVLVGGIDSQYRYIKVTNTSTTTTRIAMNMGQNGTFFASEFVSQNGDAFVAGGGSGANAKLFACYFHDSNRGIWASSSAPQGVSITRCIAAACSTTAMDVGGAAGLTSSSPIISNCTLYGSSAKHGTGVLIANTAQLTTLYNNIIYGFTAGVAQSTAQVKSNRGAYNDFFNNTGDVTFYTKDATDLALDPEFADVSEIVGTNASTAASVLTDATKNFSTVVDGVDYVRVTASTGGNTGIFLITSHTATTLTVNNSLGNGTSVAYTVSMGHDYSIGDNLAGAAFPGLYPGGLTEGFLDTGSAQRDAGASGGGGSRGLFYMG